ncbi:MAG: hypothetical protein CHACPFDD_00452 [Phycisphaerae bacterium]|nr:hypothetical protein [Phycisphaerae bacterium]
MSARRHARIIGGFGWMVIAGTVCMVVAISLSVRARSALATARSEEIPWTGEVGITETVDEIMARAAVEETWDPTRDAPIDIERLKDYEQYEEEYKEYRQSLPQNPDSPAVAQWPPAEETGGRPLDTEEPEQPDAPLLPQVVGTSFLGPVLSESGFVPPDTEGAAGPTQILMCANGRIKLYDKSGVLGPLNASTNTFFNSVRASSTTSDPRVRFDRLTNRWFVICINVSSPNRILLAVSSGATITGSSSFTFYFFQQDTVTPTNANDTGGLLDYPSLGIDNNALYIGGNMFNPGYRGSTGFVVRKTSVLSGGPIVVTAFRQMCTSSGAGISTPMGVDNADTAATEGYFIGVDNASFGLLVARRISTPGGTPTISGNLNITVPTTGFPQDVTVLGSGSNTLDGIDDRLFAAKMHKNQLTGVRTLWTSHNMEVNSSGVFSSSGNRNGSRWYQIQNMTSTPALVQSGTLFDSAASNPKSYWMPDVAMSGQGHMALGCSYGGLADRAGCAVAGRFSSDALGTIQAPTLAVVSATNYNVQSGGQRWGDYSFTCVDPNDDMTMWTFQEYCNATDSWGCRAMQLRAPLPATPASCVPDTVNTGDTNVNVVVTGTSSSGSGFYDPDATHPNHIAASVGGTGVTVNSVTFNSPTQITINVTVSAGATPGVRTITVTNPDGQAVTSAAGILTVSGACAGPSITTHPSNQTVCDGGSTTFTVVANGTPPLSYQWQKDTVDIGGATSATLNIDPVDTGDAGSYRCVVTNACGSATSNAATLTVNVAPSVGTHPSDQTVCSGGSATFTVAASGTGPLSYQWQKNTVNIGGATNASYTIDPVGTGDAGSYRCVVTNSCGSATSNAATLTVNVAPSITTHPGSQAVCDGGAVTFSVAASGTGPLGYQWQKDTVDIGGATNPSYTINPVGAGDAGSYRCVVTNTCGSATSNAATLTVSVAPSVTTQPDSQTACDGSSATFTVVAAGSGPLSYQWQKNTVDIGGATNSSYTINPVTAGDAGSYRCVVTNVCGSATSNAATLTVNDGPSISTHPSDQSVCDGGSATFTIVANGTPPLSYQWQKDTVDIGGATSDLYTINPVGAGDAASYRCVVTNACGNATSDAATLTVNVAPTITDEPDAQTACTGDSVTFTVAASGSGPLSYQWQKNTVDIGGATSSSYTINPVTAGDAGSYRCVVTNACGSATSDAAALTVNEGVSISQHPASATKCSGDSVTFSVIAGGTPPLSYQWRKGGVDIGGATNASYVIGSVAPADAGDYDVVVTNPCGGVTSNAATLAVNVGPSITDQPDAQTACSGGSATFSVVASGSEPFGYQWKKGGTDIGGATNSSYTIDPVTPADAAIYTCAVTNACGATTSDPAQLTVNEGPTITLQPVSQTVCAGTVVNFTVNANGTPNPTYQWQKDGGDLAGETSQFLTLNNVQPADAGSYACVVSNACGSVTSDAATLTVNTAPQITQQPSEQTACIGGSATFAVVASGTPAPTYQWRKAGVDLVDGGNISGATSDTLVINPVSLGDQDVYDVVIANTCGNVGSLPASLLVQEGPSISTQPTPQTECVGGSISFVVAADGTPPFSFQWRKNGGDLAGETQSSLTIDPVGAGDAGNYDCVVTNACGSATSDAAALTVNTAPTITQHPANQSACTAGSAVFTVVATGTGPLSYQWRKDGGDLSGETGDTLTIAFVQSVDAGSYDVVVTNACGSVTSNAATLTVDVGPLVTDQPDPLAVDVGDSAVFAVVASGSPPLSYQWRKGGANLADGPTGSGSVVSGATSGTLTITNVQMADADNYDVVVSNACGSTPSDPAALSVSAPCVPCDANCDGSINGFDVDPFVALLSGSGTPCSPCAGDVNADGSINGFDIDGFVAALTGGGC